MIFWDFLIFYQIYLSPQGQRIIIIKHSIYKLLHELPDDLRLKTFRSVPFHMKARPFSYKQSKIEAIAPKISNLLNNF